MSDGLYRQESLDHVNRRLFGQVILRSPPAVWWVMALLIAVIVIGGVLLFAVSVETSDGAIRLIDWILNRPAA